MPNRGSLVDDDELAGFGWEDFSLEDHVLPEFFAIESSWVGAEDGVGVGAILRAKKQEHVF